ncbi:MAG: hypothetical protein ACYC4L_21795 [Chloroflexota bacterium]
MSEVRGTSLPSLRRLRRAVLVKVLESGREVDSFEMASPQSLRAALRPIIAHLDADHAVRYQAIEEHWLPLGLDHTRHQADLAGLDAALQFLAA